MFNDVEHLRDDSNLVNLLSLYAELGKVNREAWHERVMAMDGLQPSDLVILHGELIALEWIELNVGQAPTCYRITPAGHRAFGQAQLHEPPEFSQAQSESIAA